MYPLIGDVGTPELLIIFAVVMLVFGGSKLPDLARGSGRAIRIFKEEVGRTGDDDDDASPESATDAAGDTAAARPADPAG
jgi:sec-independent protein translocase protein TatA